MLSMLFWISLLATIVLAVVSKRRWDSYHRGVATRVELVNPIVFTLIAGAATVGTWVAQAVIR